MALMSGDDCQQILEDAAKPVGSITLLVVYSRFQKLLGKHLICERNSDYI